MLSLKCPPSSISIKIVYKVLRIVKPQLGEIKQNKKPGNNLTRQVRMSHQGWRHQSTLQSSAVFICKFNVQVHFFLLLRLRGALRPTPQRLFTVHFTLILFLFFVLCIPLSVHFAFYIPMCAFHFPRGVFCFHGKHTKTICFTRMGCLFQLSY